MIRSANITDEVIKFFWSFMNQLRTSIVKHQFFNMLNPDYLDDDLLNRNMLIGIFFIQESMGLENTQQQKHLLKMT